MNFHKYALLSLAATLAACGGGGDGESNQINDWFSEPSETPPVVAPEPPAVVQPEFTPELSGVWNGTGSDSLTDTSSNVFLFTAEDGRLILASKETIYAEGSATLDGLELVGNITAEAASGTTFAGDSKTADCSFNASFKTQMNISGTYSCPAGDGGSFNVDRISPLTAAAAP